MQTSRRLLQLISPFWRWIALATLLAFATIASGVGLLMTSAWLIAKAALRPSIAELQVAIVGVRFFGISRGGFRYAERYVSHWVNFKLLARLRVWFYDRLEPLAPAGLQGFRSGDLLARIVADIDALENITVRVIAPSLAAILTLLLMGLLLGQFSLTLAASLTGFLLLAGLGLPWLARWLGKKPGKRLIIVRSELNAALVDGIQGLPDLLAYGAEAATRQDIAALNRETAAQQARMTRISGLQNALSSLLTNLAVVAALVIAIPLVRSGRLDGVNLAVVALGVMASFEAVAPLPLAAQYLENSLTAARRLFEIVGENAECGMRNAESEVRSPQLTISHSPLTINNFPLPLRLSDLRFRYGPDEPWALDGISFDLPPGGRVAVVGASGAGKSTLVNLLLRFWEPDGGEISLAGRPLSQLDPDETRRLFAVVSQNTHLFNTTVRENLRLARPAASDAEIVRAAQQAQIHPFIETLPEGYETWIGEQGLRLSGGQRQRLAIARAILKAAPILVLDEATANLDALTGQAILQTLRELRLGREPATTRPSLLMITHRLAGLEDADEILVLHQGRVVERGRHHDLLQREGLYRRMWTLQREWIDEH